MSKQRDATAAPIADGDEEAAGGAAPAVPPPAAAGPAPARPGLAHGVVDLRADAPPAPRRRRPWWPFAVVVLLPAAVALAFFGLVVSPRYAATAAFVVRADRPGGEPTAPLAALGLAGAGSSDDHLVLAYLRSPDLVAHLDGELGLRAHYADRRYDPFTRLAGDGSREDLIAHVQGRLRASYDEPAGLITLRAEANDPAMAQRLAQAALAAAERFVNESGRKLVRERADFLEEELGRVRKDLDGAQAALLAFQREHGLIDASGQATAIGGLVAGLEAELARQRAALAEVLSVHGDASEPARRQRARIAGLEAQVQAERGRIGAQGSTTAGAGAGAVVLRQQELERLLAFQADRYRATLSAHEQARVELGRRMRHLVAVAQPALPEEAAWPRPWYATVTVALCALLAYGVLRVVVGVVREHRAV